MIFPLLPAFLAVLGAGPQILGLIEGLGEATAAAFKILSGRWTDRARRRKPLVLFGYGLAGCARPLIGLATIWPTVLALRFLDRIGKGLRTSPRDALIADVSEPGARGAAFGLHRALDHTGAVLGPLAAAALLGAGLGVRSVMLLAAVPAALVLFLLAAGVRERPRAPTPPPPGARPTDESRPPGRTSWQAPPPPFPASLGGLGAPFRRLLLALFLFTLARSTDAFLILRLHEAGVALRDVTLLWALLSLVRAASTAWGGALTDRFGARAMLSCGWVWFAAVYAGLALVSGTAGLIALFFAFGLHSGFVEPAERAWVAALAPERMRGFAYGLFHAAVGLGALPGGLLFGAIWALAGAPAAFLAAAGLACAALLFLRRVPQL